MVNVCGIKLVELFLFVCVFFDTDDQVETLKMTVNAYRLGMCGSDVCLIGVTFDYLATVLHMPESWMHTTSI